MSNGSESQIEEALSAAVSAFGAAVQPRLASGQGEPEDQMRGPLETLLGTFAAAIGVSFTAVGEASLSDLKVRPDYAALVNGAINGYIEVKAPGKGASPGAWKATSHDAEQWEKLKALPNVLYTDGNEWGLYRTGELAGEVVKLTGTVQASGPALTTPDSGLARLLRSFFSWAPTPPRSINQLVHFVAPLTRLLRDEVVDTMEREAAAEGGPFTELARDWRILLFPDADDAAFADGYAQSVTFALLLARTEKIDFEGKAVDGIARELGRTHSLLGKALSVLTDESIGALSVTLDTLVRVVSVVDFGRFAKHIADPYLALYEHFLAEYDPDLRKLTGSYYTPAAVVTAMTRMTDQVLRSRLGRAHGLASDGVTIVDPAMGTGTYVLDVLETTARTVTADQGAGAVPARLTDTARRLVGIEKQAGPFAVAELRIAEALRRYNAKAPTGGVRLYVADTLDDPFAQEAHLAATMRPIAESRRGANRMKATEPVVVVLGNPPYRERARGHGGFIEDGAPNSSWVTPPLADFREKGNGAAEYVLSNLYVYFWRWATWKVFDAHADQSDGVICFITTAGYLRGPGFAGMRRYLREHASEGWIIDCTPEGHQPDVSTRIFPTVQQPVAIGLFVRRSDTDETVPAVVKYAAVHGKQAAKFATLQTVDLDGPDWETCPIRWTAPFLPVGGDEWDSSPSLGDLMPWQSPGVKPNRTWVYAPLPGTLEDRWKRLVTAKPDEKPALFAENRDADLNRKKSGLHGFPHADQPVAEEKGAPLTPVSVAYRSFDIQYLIPDDRVLSTPRTDLWRVRGDHQMFATELHSDAIRPGPALTFTALVPDNDHYKGSGGGRALPLYAGADESIPNIAPGLLAHLSGKLGVPVIAEDFFAYIAAVTAHPSFTATFAEDLRTPGVRVPITADPDLWAEATAMGRQVLWLHTRGQRCVDPAAGRPAGPPRLAVADRPMVRIAIPDSADRMPDELTYDLDTQTLNVGGGTISPVSAEVVGYEVSGMNVLRKWFGYRRSTRPQTRGEQSALDDIRPKEWPSAYTTDLLDLLQVLQLVVDRHQAQADLLTRIMTTARVTVDDLLAASVFPVPEASRDPLPKISRKKKTAEGQLVLEA